MSSSYIPDIENLTVYKAFPAGTEALFVWIPKTGGTSIHRKLEMPRAGQSKNRFKKHYSIHELKELVNPKVFAGAFKFTIVRNPWDRLVSFYFYRRRVYLKKEPHKTPEKDQFFSSFQYWIATELRAGKVGKDNLRPQMEWIYDADDNLLVDYVGRVENLESDFHAICTQLRLPKLSLDFYNKSKRPAGYRQFYSQELQQTVADIYWRDIEYLGYQF